MPSQARLAIALVVMATVMTLLNLFVLRRASAVLGLSLRARRSVAIALGGPLAATIFFRAMGVVLPMGFGRPIAVAASATELGVFVAATFLAFAMLLGAAGRAARRMATRGTSLATGNGTPATGNGSPATGNGSFVTGDANPTHRDGLPVTGDANPTHRNGPPGSLPAGDGPPALPAGAPDGKLAPPPALTRRTFVEQAAVGSALLAGGGSAAYGALFGRRDYELSTVPIRIPGLSKAADGFTIVQLSDIHVGQMVGEAELRVAEELVRKAKGDLIVLTGDLVDHDVRYAAQLGRLVRRLSEVRPVVAIAGNHDYYTGIDAVLAAVRDAGGTTLVNQAQTMLGDRGGFVLAGLDDVWADKEGGGPDLAAALADVRSDAPRIVLCHNPFVFLRTAGQVALQISGHTHGGQVNIGLRPADYVLPHPYIAGLYETNGSHIYVNRGFGTAGPAARIGAPPEVSRIVLVSA